MLAPIISEEVEEFKDYSLEEIAARIPRTGGDKILLMDSEDLGIGGEAAIYFDKLVEIQTDDKHAAAYTTVGIDTEMQKERSSEYVLEDRVQYYLARLLSRQIDHIGQHGEGYAKLFPVYSIWIIQQPYKKDRGTIKHLVFRTESGERFDDYTKARSLMHAVLIYLPQASAENESEFMRFLLDLLSGTIRDNHTKYAQMIHKNQEVIDMVDTMGPLEALVEERGKEKGMHSMLNGTIKTLKECRFSEHEITEKLVKNYKIPAADAERYVKQYY